MPAKYGWEFWINDNGRIREFIVGHENEELAKLIIQTRYPKLTFLNFVSKQRIPWAVIEMLKLDGGTGTEFAAVGEPGNTLTPQGYDTDASVPPARSPSSPPPTRPKKSSLLRRHR